ncbi:acid phosphatase domain-containing protein [Rhizoctonia solani AG-1 IA]|uniref:Acid phosphatase domain-containing protein n=1 Tax=Thanatephorus cucumeris (strain AG1-IA) TaxID=983506 RepID=L8WPX2_THACA|nr:acid phosphatase domain-containing protein [Rhizoctonia solani AG-1 IA]
MTNELKLSPIQERWQQHKPDIRQQFHSIKMCRVFYSILLTPSAISPHVRGLQPQTSKAARQLLTLLLLPASPSNSSGPRRAIDFFDTLEIYPGKIYNDISHQVSASCNISVGSKLRHFKALNKKTGIPYEEMLSCFAIAYPAFVCLGVTMQLVRDGMSWKVFQQGLELWRKRHGHDKSEQATAEESE